MANSLLRSGGVAQIPITATATAPAVLYSTDGTNGYGTNVVVADYGACEAYKVTNLDATNWLFIHVPKMHVKRGSTYEGVFVGPGETLSVINGMRVNDVWQVLGWATTASIASPAAVALNVGGGFHKKT